jgi:cytochrome o ubiquinol oxidase subunit 2
MGTKPGSTCLGRQKRGTLCLANLERRVPMILLGFWVVWRYRASNATAEYLPYWSCSRRIEAVVWSVPILTIMFIGGLIWIGSYTPDPFRPLPSKTSPLEVQVVSLDWKWLFIYPSRAVRALVPPVLWRLM